MIDGSLILKHIVLCLHFEGRRLVMCKKIIVLLLLINVLFLSSCSFGDIIRKDANNSHNDKSEGGDRMEMLNKDADDKKADERLKQIIDAINSEDKESLKSMFSKQALDEVEDLDQNMDYLFDIFYGQVKSMESDGILVSESNDYGNDIKEVKSFYSVETDKQKYLFFILECTVNTEQPDSIGIYSLRVIKAEDEETQYDSWQKMKIAGIYKPEE